MTRQGKLVVLSNKVALRLGGGENVVNMKAGGLGSMESLSSCGELHNTDGREEELRSTYHAPYITSLNKLLDQSV